MEHSIANKDYAEVIPNHAWSFGILNIILRIQELENSPCKG
jgi:hypothetical protein